jgi:hypothetical protein
MRMSLSGETPAPRRGFPLPAVLKDRLRPYPPVGAVRSVYKMLTRNASFLRHVVREGLVTRLLLPSSASRAVSRQAVLTWSLPMPASRTPAELMDWLRQRGIALSEGRNTIYLPPQPALNTLLGPQVDTYPANAGFKILKRFGAPAETLYLAERSRLAARSRLIGDPLGQLVTANYMHALGLGPRVWDVACWSAGGVSYTVFVVDHVDGASPIAGECEAFLRELRALLGRSHLRIVLPEWERSLDFKPPDCNKNLSMSGDARRGQYVDFQNFCMADPSSWTKDVAAQATRTFHFGNGRPLHGSRYLYQSVPGLSRAGKRDTSARWQWLTRALDGAGLGFAGRVVLDIGCNSGMMLHSALAAGARWGLGWDRAAVVHHASDLLLSLGTSRFHLYGADLDPSYRLENDIPTRLQPDLSEAIVLFLSVRQHVGVLDSLQRIPWRVLVYEGHQGEGLDGLPAMLEPLRRDGGVRCLSSAMVSDGHSEARPIALLVRG